MMTDELKAGSVIMIPDVTTVEVRAERRSNRHWKLVKICISIIALISLGCVGAMFFGAPDSITQVSNIISILIPSLTTVILGYFAKGGLENIKGVK